MGVGGLGRRGRLEAGGAGNVLGCQGGVGRSEQGFAQQRRARQQIKVPLRPASTPPYTPCLFTICSPMSRPTCVQSRRAWAQAPLDHTWPASRCIAAGCTPRMQQKRHPGGWGAASRGPPAAGGAMMSTALQRKVQRMVGRVSTVRWQPAGGRFFSLSNEVQR